MYIESPTFINNIKSNEVSNAENRKKKKKLKQKFNLIKEKGVF